MVEDVGLLITGIVAGAFLLAQKKRDGSRIIKPSL
jgi:hypothetical protein